VTSDEQSSIHSESRSINKTAFRHLFKKVPSYFFRRSSEAESDVNPQVALPSSSDSQDDKSSRMSRGGRSRRRTRRDSIDMPLPAAKRVAVGEGSQPQSSSPPSKSKTTSPTLPNKPPEPTPEEAQTIKKDKSTMSTQASAPARGVVCTKKKSTSASVVESTTVAASETVVGSDSRSLDKATLAPKSVSTSATSSTTVPTSKSTTASVSSSTTSTSASNTSSTTVSSTTATATASNAATTRPSNISKTATPPSERTTREYALRSRTVAEVRSTVETHLPANTRVTRVGKLQSATKSPAAFIKRNKLREHLLRSGPDAMIVTTPERHEINRQLEEIIIDTARTTLNTPKPPTRLRKVTSAAELEKELDEELKAEQSQSADEKSTDEPEPMLLSTPATALKVAPVQESATAEVAPVQVDAPTVAAPAQPAVPATNASTQPAPPATAKAPTRTKLTASISAPTPKTGSSSWPTVLPPEFMTPDLSKFKHQPYRYLHLQYKHDPESIQSIDTDDSTESLNPGCRPTVTAEELLKRKLAEKKAKSSEPKPLTKITGLDISLYEEKRNGPEYDDRENHTFGEFGIYGDEIFKSDRERDKKLMAPSNYMIIQPQIRWGMRMAVVNWLVQLHQKLCMQPETLYLAVNVMDRFLSKKLISAKRLDLVGIASLRVAAKFEETICQRAEHMAKLISSVWTEKDIVKTERFIIDLLGFEMGWPGPLNFMRRLAALDDYDLGVRVIAKYFLELSLMYECFIGVPSDMMAAAAYRLASAVAGRLHWSEEHVKVSGYTKTQLNPICHALIDIVVHPHHFYNATYLKYSSPKYLKVAPFVHTWFKERSQIKTPSNA
jgi:hypothetical protein